MPLYANLQQYINELTDETDLIPEIRKEELNRLADFIKKSAKPARLNFICTHNSRRSHISQIWAATAGAYYGLDLRCYSCGTEATAFNPRAVAAMERAGFQIYNPGGINPHYFVSFEEDYSPIACFSKTIVL